MLYGAGTGIGRNEPFAAEGYSNLLVNNAKTKDKYYTNMVDPKDRSRDRWVALGAVLLITILLFMFFFMS